ncbi:hypothetical protein [Nonomuraea jabiensis]|uniref:hypothetical protein n=1 Tax=Nonomuraea jabiensis TaxID=882448 RepID=UPI003D744DBA
MPSPPSLIDAELRAALHDGTFTTRHAAVVTLLRRGYAGALALQNVGPEEELATALCAAQACVDTLHALDEPVPPATPDSNEEHTPPQVPPTLLADTIAEIGRLSRFTLMDLAAAEHDPGRQLALLNAALSAAQLHHIMQSERP